MTRTLDRTVVLESGLLIDGRVIAATQGGFMEHVNPATGKSQKSFAIASIDEVDQAVAAARAAFDGWRRWKPDARREVLLRLSELISDYSAEIGTIVSLEVGSLFSNFVATNVSDWIRYYAGWADKIAGESLNAYPFSGIDFTVPTPVGVVGLMVAYNGPIGFCGMGGSAALAAGCCLVIKSPELAPFSCVTFGRLCLEAGIPPGVVNVVAGGPDVGHALVSHPGIDKISFTGGAATARRLAEACAATLKPMVMELGGKSANIVFADADLDQVIKLSSRFTNNAGQGCTMPTRLIIERSVYDQVLEGVAANAEAVVIGDPFDPKVTMGPVTSAGAADRILGMIHRAKDANSGTLVTGGKRVGGDLSEGFFIEPTVFGDVDNKSEIAQEEIFGPVLCAMPFDDEGQAIEMANDSQYGLAAYAHTNNMQRARRLVSELDAGSVHINGTGPGPLSPATPFGGVKQSGFGRQGSHEGIAEFLQTKNVYLNI